MNPNTKKYIFIGLIIATGLFDFFTFYFGKMYAFEINPIFVLSKSIWLILILKSLVITGLIYMILRKKNKTYFSSYAYILIGFYLIIAQIVGGVANLSITVEQPPQEKAMQPIQAIEAFTYISLLLVYYPLLMALVGFKIWEWIYLVNIKKEV